MASQLLKQALQYHQQGQLNMARATYQTVLQQNPDDGDALHLLGILEQQQGNEQKEQKSKK